VQVWPLGREARRSGRAAVPPAPTGASSTVGFTPARIGPASTPLLRADTLGGPGPAREPRDPPAAPV